MGLYSIAGFLYHPVLFLTLATSISVGKVQFTYMLLSIIRGYLIVVKIYWNYGKLIFHVHSDYSLNNNTTALFCPLDFFVLSLVALLQWYCFFLVVLDQCGLLPSKASFFHLAAPLCLFATLRLRCRYLQKDLDPFCSLQQT